MDHIMWLSRKSLKRLRKVVEFFDSVGTLVSGSLGLIFVRLLFSLGPPVLLDQDWLPAITVSLVISIAFFLSMKALNYFWLIPATEHADIITSSLRYLYHNMFGTEAGHRVTFLAQRHKYSRYIRPRYRFASGNGTILKSKSRFRKGSALAGMAWEEHSKPFMQEIPDFGGQEGAFLDHMRSELRLPPKDVARLSEACRAARLIYSYGIIHTYTTNFIGVISIDSRHEEAKGKINQTEIERIATIIASAIQKIED